MFKGRHLLSWMARILVIVIVGTGIWGGIYVYDKGFTRKWRGQLQEEFRKRGVELHFDRLTLDPFQGLVAKNVRISDHEDTASTLAVISRIRVDLDWIRLLMGEPSLNGIDVRDADLAIPLDPSDSKSPRVEIRNFQGRILFPGYRIEVGQAEGEIFGVRVAVTGTLLNPPDHESTPRDEVDPETEATEIADRANLFELVQEEMKRFDFPTTPELKIEFYGDISRLEDIRLKVSLAGENFRHDNNLIQSLDALAEVADGVIQLRQLRLTDHRGDFQAQARFDVRQGFLEYEFHSNADLPTLAGSYLPLPLFEEMRLESTPVIEAMGKSYLGEEPRHQLVGRLEFGGFQIRSVAFQRLATEFSWDQGRWMLRNLRLQHESGQLTAQILQDHEEARFRLQANMDLSELAPLADPGTAEILSNFEFADIPFLRLEGRGSSFQFKDLEIEGDADLGRTIFKGQALEHARIPLHAANGVVSYPGFRIRREEGSATGTVRYDFRSKMVELEEIRMNLIPVEAARWIDDRLASDIAPYRFMEAPWLEIQGRVDTEGGAETSVQVDLTRPARLHYDFFERTLPFEDVEGRIRIGDHLVLLENFTSTLFDGRVLGRAEIRLTPGDEHYQAALRLDGVDFEALAGLYFGYQESKGKLNGLYQFQGQGDDPWTMEGEGYLEILRGDVFAIPLLGPLSRVVDDFLPGLGYSTARQATANFTVDQGVIHTDDFQVQGENFAIYGGGRLLFLEDTLDFNIRINARGIPGMILFPVSKLFEYSGEGSLSSPTWRPRRLPSL